MPRKPSLCGVILQSNSILIDWYFRIKSVNVELGELTQHNLKQLKVLHRDIFPVAYNEKFYKDLLEAGELCKLGCTDNRP